MAGQRIENEIKLFSLDGPFAYDGDDPASRFQFLCSILATEGFTLRAQSQERFTDLYYTDTEGVFDRDRMLLRFRTLGDRAYVTMKMPTLGEGMGLSRREIEEERFNDSRFDKWKVVQDFAREVYGPVTIRDTPCLRDDIIRCSVRMSSKVRSYSFTFDKVVYTDPGSGVRSLPCYELEIECLDQSIQDDRSIMSVVRTLTEDYGFEEERVSKYARGMAYVRSLARRS
ncbi:MAG: CYTH domain-containing protein [archaeon]|nr:CYTH domain-containing protein [archaeon]